MGQAFLGTVLSFDLRVNDDQIRVVDGRVGRLFANHRLNAGRDRLGTVRRSPAAVLHSVALFIGLRNWAH